MHNISRILGLFFLLWSSAAVYAQTGVQVVFVGSQADAAKYAARLSSLGGGELEVHVVDDFSAVGALPLTADRKLLIAGAAPPAGKEFERGLGASLADPHRAPVSVVLFADQPRADAWLSDVRLPGNVRLMIATPADDEWYAGNLVRDVMAGTVEGVTARFDYDHTIAMAYEQLLGRAGEAATGVLNPWRSGRFHVGISDGLVAVSVPAGARSEFEQRFFDYVNSNAKARTWSTASLEYAQVSAVRWNESPSALVAAAATKRLCCLDRSCNWNRLDEIGLLNFQGLGLKQPE